MIKNYTAFQKIGYWRLLQRIRWQLSVSDYKKYVDLRNAKLGF